MLLLITTGIICFFIGCFATIFFTKTNNNLKSPLDSSRNQVFNYRNDSELLDSNPELVRVTDLGDDDLEKYFESIEKRKEGLLETANRKLRSQDITTKHSTLKY